MSPEGYVRALTFAARAHGAQQTPHGLPYLVHVCSVAAEVIAALAVEVHHDAELAVACALLHDVVEDTTTSVAEVAAAFGDAVARGVSALSKDPALPRAVRMGDSLDRILDQPPEIAMVKLADRITNLGPPPPRWTATKIGRYRDEAGEILDRLGGASPVLAARLASRIAIYPPR